MPLSESVNTAAQFLPILDDRTCSPLKQQLPFTIRNDARKAPSPFFRIWRTVHIIAMTSSSVNRLGLLRKVWFVKIVVQLLQPPRIKNIATNGGGGVIENLLARNLAKTSNSLLRKAPFFINVILAFIRFYGWFGIL